MLNLEYRAKVDGTTHHFFFFPSSSSAFLQAKKKGVCAIYESRVAIILGFARRVTWDLCSDLAQSKGSLSARHPPLLCLELWWMLGGSFVSVSPKGEAERGEERWGEEAAELGWGF